MAGTKKLTEGLQVIVADPVQQADGHTMDR